MRTSPTATRSRRPAGVPTGGQFAPEAHAEPEVTLGVQPSVEPESVPETDGSGTTRWRNSAGQLHRIDGPAVERADGSRMWWVNDHLHRTDGPAVEYADGSRKWYINGQLHRIDGPAIEYTDGSGRWYINDRQLDEDEFRSRFPDADPDC